MDVNEINGAVVAQSQKLHEPFEILVSVGDSRGSEPDLISEWLNILSPCVGCLLWSHAGLDLLAGKETEVWFVESEDVVGAFVD